MPESTPVPETSSRRIGLGAAAVFVLVFAVFLPVLSNGFVNWDDTHNIVRNTRYRGFAADNLRWMFTTFHLGHYQPLSWLSLAFDFRLWGLRPAGYHLTAAVLHAANAVLLYLFIVGLARREGAAAVVWGAAAGALWFGLHPLRVEPVAWATARRDLLSTFFLLLSATLWTGAVADGAPRPHRRTASLLAFAASLLAKAGGVMFPVALLALDVVPLRRRGATEPWPAFARRMIVEKLPFFALSAAVGCVAWMASQSSGAMRTLAGHGLPDRIVQAGYGAAFYAGKTVAPFELSPLYRIPADFGATAWPYAPIAALAAAGLAAVAGGRRRWPGFAAACFAGLALAAPVLGFVQSGPQLAADRYTYLAALPFAVWLGLAAGRGFGATRPVHRALLGLAAATLLAVGAAATVRQLAVWRDSVTLWTHTLRLDPGNAIAWNNLGVALNEAGRPVEARTAYERALAADPDHVDAWINLGALRFEQGDAAGARADFERALALDPAHAQAYNNRGNVRRAAGETAAARQDYDRALALDPDYAQAWYNRGALRGANGDPGGALDDYAAALRLDPNNSLAWHNRGILRQKQGDRAGAIEDYRRALRLNPALADAYRAAGLDPSAWPAP